MVRLVIVIATVSVIVIAGLIIYKIGPPGSIETTGNGGPNTTSGSGSPTGPKESSVHTVSINAVPWAEVLIKSPETNEEISYGYTPITVDVPIEAKVILRYNNEEQAFSYKIWKDEKRISHDFLGQ